MIVRILGEGQLELPADALEELNGLDRDAELALADPAAFATALTRLLATVRRLGTPLAPDALLPSDLVLPPADATADEVRHLFDGDGLVPG